VCFVVWLRGRKVKADNDADADYDRAARELAFEAKGQVGGRQRLCGCLLAAAATVRWAVCPVPFKPPCAGVVHRQPTLPSWNTVLCF
jgi:hypothetical protein